MIVPWGACMLLMLGLSPCVDTVDSDIVGPNSNVTIANGAAILGFSGGLYICGIRPQHSEWIQAVDANGTFTQKVVFSGDQRKADHVYVVDKYDGCYYFCVRHASFEDAGLYQVYDTRHNQNVGGGFLLVISRAISQPIDGDIGAEAAMSPSDRIAAASVDGRQVFRVDYAGLMEPYLCRNELGHDVMTCRCGKNSAERSFIECKSSAALSWNDETTSRCPIPFYPKPQYPNAANDSVCLNSLVLANMTDYDVQTTSGSENQWHARLSVIILVPSIGLTVIIASIFVYRAFILKKGRWRDVSSAA
jgi:hypothetical protein